MKKIFGILAFVFCSHAFASDCTPLVKNDEACVIKVFIPALHCKNNGEEIQIPTNTLEIKKQGVAAKFDYSGMQLIFRNDDIQAHSTRRL